MSGGGDNFSSFTQGVDLLAGIQDIDALVNYLAGYSPPKPPYDPADSNLNKPRLVKLP